MVRLHRALRRLEADLRQMDIRWALIGGLAVNARGEPRTTRDIDIAVAVEPGDEDQRIVGDFMARGYRLHQVLERRDRDQMATVRLIVPGQDAEGILVDLLFASAGIEPEVVAAAELLEIFPGLVMPIVTLGHLLALKVRAGREKDVLDLPLLLPFATAQDIQQARHALDLMARRGYVGDDERDLQAEFSRHLKTYSS